ncbi:hypothetical protein PCANC_27823 [Puccinia coronata f. sp. avenae]|uniref:Uncharacterized protein n=1 Tax=Puccinia coronata f. sp. avenae TaxID=200324 RepID=A0A2N5S0X1_9BASI|nr:hypothetical protein PCANC_27823 [Puccinia coronata f. sp. avenae]
MAFDDKSSSAATGGNVTLNVAHESSGRPSSARLPLLTAPGADSNYLDWELVVSTYFEALGVSYVLKEVALDSRDATWAKDNIAVFSVLLQVAGE